ncbi:DUF427 domain-containing protein [Hoeflea prorocentri]|uniref:DUF427 domain-containing protein n=1 Tax=Hoeflea prorocentri TaxID=1922333 RepID=A0A9X3UI10_9HYPH|nr:DUF427 domain-containing protein [Hoeflea prorocentri]MCY6381190.1 DUF427 domain-containing protein [Hoeflea prorocentri]MDA5398990.1 DUF427 domain-containing protein [Hoeflea prorocentri]
MIENAIHNPDRPQHFMQVDAMEQKIHVMRGGQKIAESSNALRLQEVGRKIYPPQYYIPRSDIVATLKKTEKSTYCPLKGQASYFDVTGADQSIASELAWSYEQPLEFAGLIADYVAFDPRRVTITIEANEA